MNRRTGILPPVSIFCFEVQGFNARIVRGILSMKLGAPASRRRVALKGKILAAETAALPGKFMGSMRDLFRRILAPNPRGVAMTRRWFHFERLGEPRGAAPLRPGRARSPFLRVGASLCARRFCCNGSDTPCRRDRRNRAGERICLTPAPSPHRQPVSSAPRRCANPNALRLNHLSHCAPASPASSAAIRTSQSSHSSGSA